MTDTGHPSGSEEEVRRIVAEVWVASRPSIEGQLSTLEEAVGELAENGRREPAQRARAEAHKLAGSLGMFGLWEASSLARRIELYLERGTSTRNTDGELSELVPALRRALDQGFGET